MILQFHNRTNKTGNVCIFQRYSNARAQPLAWLCKESLPHKHCVFEWNNEYSFFFAPGMDGGDYGKFVPTQSVVADPNGYNTITADMTGLGNPVPGGKPGALTISMGHFMPGRAELPVAGIGMSGAPAIVMSLQPAWTYVLDVQHSLWVAFGDYHQGAVLDLESMPNIFELKIRGDNAKAVVELFPGEPHDRWYLL